MSVLNFSVACFFISKPTAVGYIEDIIFSQTDCLTDRKALMLTVRKLGNFGTTECLADRKAIGLTVRKLS